ncbi:c-type cytochrome domain-containing protein [Yoonia sp.]|uniref:c-type cytochrome domain-containing protein n=1 Tax=Yoonia sp. TaxID=2212373 RepID=UPI002FD8D3DC
MRCYGAWAHVEGKRMAIRQSIVFLAVCMLPVAAEAQDWSGVASVLQDRCVFCHAGDYAPLGLQLDSYAGLVAGSENGPVVILGDAGASALYRRIMGQVEPRMPMDGPPFLEADEIALIAAWIDAGASGPAVEEQPATTAAPDPREDGQITYGEVARIFGQACIRCHSDNGIMDRPPEGLRLDSYEAILSGGERVVLIPGNAQASEIVRRIEGLADPRMPFDGPPWLADDDIALIRDWIETGAMSDDGRVAPLPVGGQVRLRGVMTAPDAIDGAAFVITGQTRVDDRPAVGSHAELRARIGADGQLVADRLRER